MICQHRVSGPRFASIALFVALLTLALPSVGYADDIAKAEELNDEGKRRIAQIDLEGAAALFRQALRLHNDPRYAFNLCYTLEKSGYLGEAKRHCADVQNRGDKTLVFKAGEVLARIKMRQAGKPQPADASAAKITAPPKTAVPPRAPMAPTPPPPKLEAMRYGAFLGFVSSKFSGCCNDAKSGLNVGVGLHLPANGNFSLVVGGEIMQAGGPYSGRDDNGDNFFSGDVSFLYLVASGAARYHLSSFYAEAGLNFGLRAYLDSDTNIDRTGLLDYGIAPGVGLWLETAGHIVDVRVRYIYGLAEAMDDEKNRVFTFTGTLWW